MVGKRRHCQPLCTRNILSCSHKYHKDCFCWQIYAYQYHPSVLTSILKHQILMRSESGNLADLFIGVYAGGDILNSGGLGQIGCPVGCARALEDRAWPYGMGFGSGRGRFHRGCQRRPPAASPCEPPRALVGIRLLADSNLELDHIDHPIRHQPKCVFATPIIIHFVPFKS